MLYYRDLYRLFFHEYPIDATEFIALSGYVGPEPVSDLSNLSFDSKVIFGLFRENQRPQLHNQLLSLHQERRQILYPNILCHSKCYLWLKDNIPVKGLIGSANFSSNGLRNDYRESLISVERNQLFVLKGYIELILDSARPCTEYDLVELPPTEIAYDRTVCRMVLFDPRTGQTHLGSGLNWGLAEGSHVRPNDAFIPIRVEHIRRYPNLFPPLQPNPERRRGSINEVVEIIWDDGVVMQGRLEGSQPIDGIRYPKNFASFPHKDNLGIYIRERLGIPSGERILREDLVRYGRDDISVSLLEDGVYYFDFSV